MQVLQTSKEDRMTEGISRAGSRSVGTLSASRFLQAQSRGRMPTTERPQVQQHSDGAVCSVWGGG